MSKGIKRVIGIVLVIALMSGGIGISAQGAGFTPNPKTQYAKDFVALCGEEQWFINEVERLLNQNKKTIDTLSGTADLSEIKSLGLNSAGIKGKIPAAIGELTELEHLFLGGNKLSGEVPEALFELEKLKNIDLSANDYSGAIPDGFGTMDSLRYLDVDDNDFSGTLPGTFSNNETMTYLSVAGNKLSGEVPAWLGSMTGLEFLNLSRNSWTGSLPLLSGLENLVSLSAWNANLSGGIPDSIYELKSIRILDLSGNNLTGDVSAKLAQLEDLEFLSLGNNDLRGTLPDAFGMSGLKKVDLASNNFRGHVPATLAATSATVYLENNYMTGSALLGMGNNTGNFTDSASTSQYRVTASQTEVQISENTAVNILQYISNTPVNGTAAAKALLNPDEYVVTVVSGDAGRVEQQQTANGIYITAKDEIPKSDGYKIEIMIKANTGSEYSKVTILLTTDTVSAPPIGGGTPAPAAEYHNPYVNGYPDGSFRPGGNISREEIAAMIVKALELETDSYTTSSYPDISAKRWSLKYIEAATAAGYFKGYTDGSFGPGGDMTRAELAALVVRIAETLGVETTGSSVQFSDVDSGKWYSEYIEKAARYGLVNGYSDGSFRPDKAVSRAEAVTMINRMLGRDPKTAAALATISCPFSDTASTYWAYLDVMEAAVGHEH